MTRCYEKRPRKRSRFLLLLHINGVDTCYPRLLRNQPLQKTIFLFGICHQTYRYASGIIIDGYCGVLVGMFILYSGFVAAKDTISPLLGQPPEPELVQQINDIVLSYDNVIGIHDLIVHNYGPGRTLISLHAEVPADGNIITLHDTIDTIEHELRRKLNCNAVIHMDPVSTSDPETLSLKAEVSGYLDQIDPKLSMHDFRIVKGPTHTNVIFDIVIPYDYPVSDQEVMDSITKRIQTSHPDFFTVIEVDKAVVQ